MAARCRCKKGSPGCEKLPAIDNLKAVGVIRPDSFTVGWDIVTGATDYEVTITPDGTSVVVQTLTNRFSGLAESTTYTVCVRAMKLGGSSSTACIQVSTPAIPSP